MAEEESVHVEEEIPEPEIPDTLERINNNLKHIRAELKRQNEDKLRENVRSILEHKTTVLHIRYSVHDTLSLYRLIKDFIASKIKTYYGNCYKNSSYSIGINYVGIGIRINCR